MFAPFNFSSMSSRSLVRNVVMMDLCASSASPTGSRRLEYSPLVTLLQNLSINSLASTSGGSLNPVSLDPEGSSVQSYTVEGGCP